MNPNNANLPQNPIFNHPLAGVPHNNSPNMRNRNNIIGTNENLEVEANIDDLLNKSELYRFTFKKDNDNYYFESMKKMGN